MELKLRRLKNLTRKSFKKKLRHFICSFLDTSEIIQLVKLFQFSNWYLSASIAGTLGRLHMPDAHYTLSINLGMPHIILLNCMSTFSFPMSICNRSHLCSQVVVVVITIMINTSVSSSQLFSSAIYQNTTAWEQIAHLINNT